MPGSEYDTDESAASSSGHATMSNGESADDINSTKSTPRMPKVIVFDLGTLMISRLKSLCEC